MSPLNLAFLPVGDNFTMGVDDAVIEAEFLKPKVSAPFGRSVRVLAGGLQVGLPKMAR